MSNQQANVAILLTPRTGNEGSAIAVVRLRGPATAEFLSRFFSAHPKSGRSVHGNLYDGETIIDDAIVVIDEKDPYADLCLHGGAWVIESTLNLARREGFQILDQTLPLQEAAFDAGDELEHEVLAYLPMARTPEAVRMLLDQPRAWNQAKQNGFDATAVLADKTLWRLLHPSEIAIVGEPNVGKSTLANRLFGRERSITADVPGTTRDWVGEMADIDGLPAVLIDTPGIRETADEIERAAIGASRERIREIELVIRVLDATSKNTPHLSPRPTHGEPEIKEIVATNKIDLVGRAVTGAIGISARTGEGIDRLIAEIHKVLGVQAIDHPRMRWWTDRQRDWIQATTQMTE
jgi:small GTP-binding protein